MQKSHPGSEFNLITIFQQRLVGMTFGDSTLARISGHGSEGITQSIRSAIILTFLAHQAVIQAAEEPLLLLPSILCGIYSEVMVWMDGLKVRVVLTELTS